MVSFPTREEFISCLRAEKEHNYCKVAILGLHETMEQYEMIDQSLAPEKKVMLAILPELTVTITGMRKPITNVLPILIIREIINSNSHSGFEVF